MNRAIIFLAAVAALVASATGQTAFTYQGQLMQSGLPVSGNVNLIFTLYDDPSLTVNHQIGNPITLNNQPLLNGLFTVPLDFGANAFPSARRWVQVSVNGVILSPRQEVTPTPYALGLRLPYVGNASVDGNAFSVTNSFSSGTALYGHNLDNGIGVFGESPNGNGVYGQSGSGFGVYGLALSGTTKAGIRGISTAPSGMGVWGSSGGGIGGIGVFGESDIGTGVEGCATGSGFGVYASSDTGYGVYAGSDTGTGVFGLSNTGYGIQGASNAAANYAGVYGQALGTDSNGVLGEANNGVGVYGQATTGTGVFGWSKTSGIGVEAVSASGLGIDGYSSSNYGIRGIFANGSNLNVSIFAKSAVWGDSGTGNGVMGTSSMATAAGVVGWSPISIGVYGYTTNGNAIYGARTGTGWAGYFQGPLYAQSASASIKAFRIDHPVDPENKYLQHSSVESPDMKNVYDGNIVLGNNGEAWVELPTYFEALNRDFRYQLTCIGQPALVYIKQEISGNRFLIAGGKKGMKVSWQVTGIRQDPAANLYRIEVEPNKADKDRGKFLVPEAYGQPKESGINPPPNSQETATTAPGNPRKR
jgi:hypothetical protein